MATSHQDNQADPRDAPVVPDDALSPDVVDSRGRPLTYAQRLRAGILCNLSNAIGMPSNQFAAPGSIFVVLMMKEWLGTSATQIGLVAAILALGPVFELVGAQVLERLGHRKLWFTSLYFAARFSLVFVAVIPLLGRSAQALVAGVWIIYAVTVVSRITGYLSNPALVSWFGDLIPEDYRGRFYGQRTQWVMAVSTTFLIGSFLMDRYGGMKNPTLIAALVGIGAALGIVEALIFIWIPEPRMYKGQLPLTVSEVLGWVIKPFLRRDFRFYVLSMAAVSFGAGLLGPFTVLYLRRDEIGGQALGLGVTWTYLAVLNLMGSLAGVLWSKFWGKLADRLRPQYALSFGLLSVLTNVVFFFVGPDTYLIPVAVASLANGFLGTAMAIGMSHLLLDVTPREHRSFYLAANSAALALISAAGPYLGGRLADRFGPTSWILPGGEPFCYVHLLFLLACVFTAVALVLVRQIGSGAAVATPAAAQPPPAAARIEEVAP